MLENHNKLSSILLHLETLVEKNQKKCRIHAVTIDVCIEGWWNRLQGGEKWKENRSMSPLTTLAKVLLKKVQKQTVETKLLLSRRLKKSIVQSSVIKSIENSDTQDKDSETSASNSKRQQIDLATPTFSNQKAEIKFQKINKKRRWISLHSQLQKSDM